MRAMKLAGVMPVCVVLLACATLRHPSMPRASQDGWRIDPAWHDGLAEVCTYDATRTIYGRVRTYTASAYTNTEHVDPRTGVKSVSDGGVEVFKHHWSERVPTESYDYDFSTMTYTRVEDMRAWKLTAATQEDCGASFKEAWRAEDGALAWWESVYFPGAGRRTGSIADAGSPDGSLCFFDALTLRLRDYDFQRQPELRLRVVPMQKDTHSVPFAPETRTVRFAGTEEIEVPMGRLRAHQLELVDGEGVVEARFWFAADATAPMLHALVRFEGPQGITYALRSLERKAYWKRG